MSVWTHEYLFYSVVYNLTPSSFILLFRLFQPRLSGAFSRAYAFWHIPSSSEYFFLQDALVSSCIFPAPCLQSVCFARSPDSFSWRMEFKNQDLGSECAHCCCGALASRCSQWMEFGNTCMYTNPSLNFHLCLPDTPTHVHTHVSSSHPTPQGHSRLPPFLIYNFFLWRWETCLSLSTPGHI